MEWIMMEAVARELSPRERRVARWWSLGGVDGEWDVVRRTATWRDKVWGLERRASFESEILSLTMPISSLIVVMPPNDPPWMNSKLNIRERVGEI